MKFLKKLLEEDRDLRVDSAKAKEVDFLKDSMLDDNAARKTIREVISLSGLEKTGANFRLIMIEQLHMPFGKFLLFDWAPSLLQIAHA